jgi:hypothetical protein
MIPAHREAVAVGQWRVVLAQTRIRCLYEAQSALRHAERLGSIRRQCQQRDARIYVERCQDALLTVAAIDEMTTTPPPRRAVPEALPRRAMAEEFAPRRELVPA